MNVITLDFSEYVSWTIIRTPLMIMKYTSNKWFLCSLSISAAVSNHMAETIYFLIYFSLKNLLIISFNPI